MLSNIFSPVNIVTVLALSVAVSSNPTRVFRNRRLGDVDPRSLAEHRPLKQFDIRDHKKRLIAETVPKPQTSYVYPEPPFPVTGKVDTSSPGTPDQLESDQLSDVGNAADSVVASTGIVDSNSPDVLDGQTGTTAMASNAVSGFANLINSASKQPSLGRRSTVSDLNSEVMRKLAGPAVSVHSPGSEANGERPIQGTAGLTQDSTPKPNGDVTVAPPLDHDLLINTDNDSTGGAS